VQQRHRIQSARNGDENFFSARQEPTRLDFAFEALKEFAHAAMLRFFCAAGKLPDYGASMSR
jgi:hypothetical protein